MKLRAGTSLFPVIATFCLASAQASIITIDFEGLADSTDVATTYLLSDVIFGDALAITAGISLDDSEFPPHSGQNVATDNGGPITVTFTSPVSSFYAYFTYTTQLTMAAFSHVNVPLTSMASAFGQNYASSGNPSNELIGVNYATGIDHVTITGDPAGGSFVMDDVTFNTTVTPVSSAPEPGTAAFISVSLAAWFAAHFKSRRAKIQTIRRVQNG